MKKEQLKLWSFYGLIGVIAIGFVWVLAGQWTNHKKIETARTEITEEVNGIRTEVKEETPASEEDLLAYDVKMMVAHQEYTQRRDQAIRISGIWAKDQTLENQQNVEVAMNLWIAAGEGLVLDTSYPERKEQQRYAIETRNYTEKYATAYTDWTKWTEEERLSGSNETMRSYFFDADNNFVALSNRITQDSRNNN